MTFAILSAIFMQNKLTRYLQAQKSVFIKDLESVKIKGKFSSRILKRSKTNLIKKMCDKNV